MGGAARQPNRGAVATHKDELHAKIATVETAGGASAGGSTLTGASSVGSSGARTSGVKQQQPPSTDLLSKDYF